MLYLVTGDNYIKSRDKVKKIIDTLKGKRIDSLYIKIDEYSEDQDLLSAIEESGLFEKKRIVFFDRVGRNSNAFKIIEENIIEMNDSANIFIVFEMNINKKFLDKVKKIGVKIEENTLSAQKVINNVFVVTDNLLARDRTATWRNYHDSLKAGISVENIAGAIVWQLKTLILSFDKDNGADVINRYVLEKTKKYVHLFKKEDVLNMMISFQETCTAHSKNIPKEMLVESWILKHVGK